MPHLAKVAAALLLLGTGSSAWAASPVKVATPYGFDDLIARVETAAKTSGLVVVAEASASRAAAARGIKIPGNAVIELFNNIYAVRMLAASMAAGIEAPLRLYLTENADGTTTITYRRPTRVFAPYRSPALHRLAVELDGVFAKLVAEAVEK